ncbi:hypothetical protein F5B22DRAFT_647658 [Xylaria bambusicola]|uniref:uncharacterized protein n=1 Tax=Xylaria bambusicola TaxID=326684 RepID=UPI002007B496|nr:uncharacterized protein F5B22DRAFT_647658 [Xylaria bambusicola]KAI0514345.1 hypothetical protein F5B22DRAFT_647658 [Xylaria bambusicola]
MNSIRRWVKGFTGSQDRQYEESLPLTSNNPNSIGDDDWMPPRSRSSPTIRWLIFLLPFCIARPLGLTERKLPKTMSTTYLNGIRGLACWIVFNEHMVMDKYREIVFKPYGAVKDGQKFEHFIQLPLVRALIAGKGMVCVFFVLSGFVLSYSSLRKINDAAKPNKQEKTSRDDLLTSVSSMTLRRAIRLFGPLLALAFITALVTYYVPWGDMDRKAPNIFAHVWTFWLSAVTVMDPYHWPRLKPLPRHYGQAWTLGVEYRLSLVMFLMIATTATLTTVARKSVIIFVAAWSVYCARRWDVACAMGGMLLAELRFAPLSDDISRLFNRPIRITSKWLTTIPAVFFVLLGTLLCSWPETMPSGADPYRSIWELTPLAWRPDSGHGAPEPVGGWLWWWGTIGAFLMLWGLEQLPVLQKVLSVSFLKYLGEISYAYYLLQGLGHTHVGNPLYAVLQDKYGWSKNSAFAAGYIVGNIFNIIASDYFWRVIDESCIRLARFVVVELLGVGKQPGNRSPGSAVGYTPVPTAAPTSNEGRSESDNFAIDDDDVALKEGFDDGNDADRVRRRRAS